MWAFHLQSVDVYGDKMVIGLWTTQLQVFGYEMEDDVQDVVASVYRGLRPGSWTKIAFHAPTEGIEVNVAVEEYNWGDFTSWSEDDDERPEARSVKLTGRVTLLQLFKAALGVVDSEAAHQKWWAKVPHPSTFSKRHTDEAAGRKYIGA